MIALKTCWVAAGLLAVGAAPSAQASFLVTFEEDAPRDRFTFTNQGDCIIGPFELVIGLEGSVGALVFDTVPGGPGENVAQRVIVTGGSEVLALSAAVQDGDRAVALSFQPLQPGQRASIGVDLDDALVSSPMGRTMIAGMEIEGAEASATLRDGTQATGTFNATGAAIVPIGCPLQS